MGIGSLKAKVMSPPALPDTEKILKNLAEAILALAEVLRSKGLEHNAREELSRGEKLIREAATLFNKFLTAAKELRVGYGDLTRKQAEQLAKARDMIVALKAEIARVTSPPLIYGTFLSLNNDDTVNVTVGGKKHKVNVVKDLAARSFKAGQQVILNDVFCVIAAAPFETRGVVGKVVEILGGNRARVCLHHDEEMIACIGEPLRGKKIKAGDEVLIDPDSGYLLERLPKSEMGDLLLEEVPSVTYSDIGGLDAQIETIRDAVELPYLYPEVFREHKLQPPKGVLLYGPPGCGKTLIAKAVANSLAQSLQNKTGVKTKGYFINIKGPELLNKYVGETERKIREIFQTARERAQEGVPVVVFFDELDSLLRTRGSGISSDVESTIVPQFLAEIDGVEPIQKVVVIAASNRQDLIDPAVLRPGRFDVKIRIDRPTLESARDIFSKYCVFDLPWSQAVLGTYSNDAGAVAAAMIETALGAMFSTDDSCRFLEITYVSGQKETLYFKDFVSGALIENVVARAKKTALKRFLKTGHKGLVAEDFIGGVRDEFKENEDLPNTTNPDDWVKIAGRKKEQIVHVKPLFRQAPEGARKVETVNTTGQYL